MKLESALTLCAILAFIAAGALVVAADVAAHLSIELTLLWLAGTLTVFGGLLAWLAVWAVRNG